MFARNEDAEECMSCGEVPRSICEDCGCCQSCCECEEEEDD